MPSRILITADLLRPFPRGPEWESATWKNVRWLRHLLAPALAECGFEVGTLSWDERVQGDGQAYFETPVLYHRLGRELSLESWAQLARSDTAPAALLEALAPHCTGALVIGYEMPEVMIDALRQLGCPFVDLILHPWRFLPDLVFALRTNVPAYDRVFRRLRIPPADVQAQAARIQAKSAWMAPTLAMPPGTVLVLGQVPTDRAMVSAGGRFASLDEHVSRLHALCCDHPLVLFKPHPYADAADRSMRTIGRVAAIQSTTENFYHLLCQPELEGVVALNSSGLIEARVFGRWGENLVPLLYDYDADVPPSEGAPGSPIPMTSHWTDPRLWKSILAGSDDIDGLIGEGRPEPNLLRRSMNADWGYGFIERVCA